MEIGPKTMGRHDYPNVSGHGNVDEIIKNALAVRASKGDSQNDLDELWVAMRVVARNIHSSELGSQILLDLRGMGRRCCLLLPPALMKLLSDQHPDKEI